MSEQTTETPSIPLMQYLTVGGATVDLTQTIADRESPDYGEVIDLTLVAQCNGCKSNDENEYPGLYSSVLDRVLESPYGRHSQNWAQAHAEKCRALPRPTNA